MDIHSIALFLSTNETLFRAIMIALEILLIIILFLKYTTYTKKHKNVGVIEFVLNAFFADTINPFPGYTDFFWIPVFSFIYGLTSFSQATGGQIFIYEVVTAIIGFIAFKIIHWYYGRKLEIRHLFSDIGAFFKKVFSLFRRKRR